MAKQAVVVFHGMGDQTPMATLKLLTDAVWVHDTSLIERDQTSSSTGEPTKENEIWSKPDGRNRSYELYRLTTGKDKKNQRTDFYEFFWAHHVQGTTWDQVKTWLFDLMLRKPARVPDHVKPVWLFLWVAILIALGLIAGAIYLKNIPNLAEFPLLQQLVAYLPIIGVLLSAIMAWVISTIMVKRVGDVVRYTKQKPENIAIRQKIREAGVELLEELNSPESRYDRIIIVAHSLGTIVAYDILSHAFVRCNSKLDFRKVYQAAEKEFEKDPEKLAEFKHQPALKALEDFLEETTTALRNNKTAAMDIDVFRAHQRAAQKELVAYGCPWHVTDFITLGSPLTHAEFLLADGEPELRNAQIKRQFPTCPPVQEFEKGGDPPKVSTRKWKGRFRLTYDAKRIKKHPKGEPRIPHHGTVFAFTRWTNIHSPRKGILGGDLVSGPVSHLFGQSIKTWGADKWHRLSGISDIAVLPERDAAGRVLPGHGVPSLTHNNYWNLDAKTGEPAGTHKSPPHHIKMLRDALHLLED